MKTRVSRLTDLYAFQGPAATTIGSSRSTSQTILRTTGFYELVVKPTISENNQVLVVCRQAIQVITVHCVWVRVVNNRLP